MCCKCPPRTNGESSQNGVKNTVCAARLLTVINLLIPSIQGPIISTSVFGQRIIIINSSELAIDMLNKKSAIYSDRPVLQMGGELVGWKDTLILLRYGKRFRDSRRMSHKLFGSHSTMKQFLPMLEQETRKSLGRLMRKPEGFAEVARK
jgi:cytochrome P450